VLRLVVGVGQRRSPLQERESQAKDLKSEKQNLMLLEWQLWVFLRTGSAWRNTERRRKKEASEEHKKKRDAGHTWSC
jgi:hypothetical protein